MICFAWDGFPQYAARCIGAFVRQTNEEVVVIGTTPDVPIKGMEALAQCPVYWIKPNEQVDIKQLLGEIPTQLIVSGWGIQAFNQIADTVRASSGTVIASNDANYIFSFKEILRALRFRFLLKHKYDAFFVPGNAGTKLMRFYGSPKDKIVSGMYAADATLFTDGGDILARPKKMVYVGRLCERKNVRGLCKAFVEAKGPEKGWTLELYGCGEQKDLLPKDNPAIQIHDFLQPEQLASVYKTARCFVLASFEEHWGLVVHEAALSGCVLLLSDCIGAAADLLTSENGVTFNPKSIPSFVKAMRKVFAMNEETLSRAYVVSLEMAKTKGTDVFVAGVNKLLEITSSNS